MIAVGSYRFSLADREGLRQVNKNWNADIYTLQSRKYFTECANVRKIYWNIRSVLALKYWKANNRSKTISVQL